MSCSEKHQEVDAVVPDQDTHPAEPAAKEPQTVEQALSAEPFRPAATQTGDEADSDSLPETVFSAGAEGPREAVALPWMSALLETERKLGVHGLRIRRFAVAKSDGGEADFEDRGSMSEMHAPHLRIAVADGASEGLFSGEWAELLVQSFLEHGECCFDRPSLAALQDEFLSHASQVILNAPELRRWFLFEKLDRGTAATFVGLEFGATQTMRIAAVGDSCAFWRIGDEPEVKMWPCLMPEEFGNRPEAIYHLERTWERLSRNIQRTEVQLPSERFQVVLCTDALACWLAARSQETAQRDWSMLFDCPNVEQFAQWVQTRRQSRELRNDDVMMVLVDALPLNV